MKQRKKSIYLLLLGLVTILLVIPLLWMILLSFKSNAEILGQPLKLFGSMGFKNYINAWNA